MNNSDTGLTRKIGAFAAISLVIGTIIGTGIFLKTPAMTKALGSPELVLLVWFFAGVLSLAGALCYAELGAMLPRAGGEYVYLRSAYGGFVAFLYGWMRVVAGSTGGIAALGVGFSIFFCSLFGIDQTSVEVDLFAFSFRFGWIQAVAVLIVMLLTGINCIDVSAGGFVQSLLTAIKVLGFAGLFIAAILFSDGAGWDDLNPELRKNDISLIGAFGVSMIAALWAYDGWNNMPMAAGEVKRAEVVVPFALIGGISVVIFVYLLTNIAYFRILTVDEIALVNDSEPIATLATVKILGSSAAIVVGAAIMVSIAGSLNGTILTSARVPFAMAIDGAFPKSQGEVNGHGAPRNALVVQGIISSVMAMLGTFDQLTDLAVFSMWIFYVLTVASVIILRRKMPDLNRPYRTLAYPLTPILFVLVGALLIVNSLVTQPFESLIGVGLIVAGTPIYLFYHRKVKQ